MAKIVIRSFAEFEKFIGKELGVSEYIKVTQEKINQFAEATFDRQWIHVDPVRAAKESPFGKTIAHGYMAVSLTPFLWEQIADIQNYKMLINYGVEKLKFAQPVLVDSEVRLRVNLASLVNLRGVTKAQLDATLEIKDNPKPAFTATIVFLYHFN